MILDVLLFKITYSLIILDASNSKKLVSKKLF
jgi:hypothetical protein